MLAAVHAHPREDARERQNPRRQAGAANRSRGPRTTPGGEVDGLGRPRVAGGGTVDERAQLTEVARFGEGALVDARLERVFECNHQLHAIEGAESQLVERRVRRNVRPTRVLGNQTRELVAARFHRWRRRAVLDPLANLRAFQFARALGPRQLALRPQQRAPDFLMILELGVRLAHHVVERGVGIEDHDRVDSFFSRAG